jgi:hypothetical protein
LCVEFQKEPDNYVFKDTVEVARTFSNIFFILSVAEINECDGENDCHDNATCINTIGSYNCSCNDGFEGNGTLCQGRSKVYLFAWLFRRL